MGAMVIGGRARGALTSVLGVLVVGTSLALAALFLRVDDQSTTLETQQRTLDELDALSRSSDENSDLLVCILTLVWAAGEATLSDDELVNECKLTPEQIEQLHRIAPYYNPVFATTSTSTTTTTEPPP